MLYIILYYPPAAPTNRHRALGLDIGLIDLTKEFWSQVGTFFQPCMAQNGYKIDTKMVPKWYQNGTKMVPRWSLGGSWGHLGGKLGPRWSQEGSKVEKERSPTPPGTPPRNPNFSYFHHQGGSQEAWRPSWIACCVQTPIFGFPGPSLDPKNLNSVP